MIPVLEIGGTHVTAALVAPHDWALVEVRRHDVDASGSARKVLDGWVAAARSVPAPAGARWGVAMPDPFDYARGVALFDASVGKFGALHGVDVGAALRAALDADVAFVNDADAFALGEWTLRPSQARPRRLVGLTLGTGVGSGWVADGAVVDPGVPAGGRIHTTSVEGRALEDVFSRRAIRRAYAAAADDADADVREICDRARAGDGVATQVLQAATTALGAAVGPLVRRFEADALVVGGSMAASWDLFEQWFGPAGLPAPTSVSVDAERSGVVGAAVHSLR